MTPMTPPDTYLLVGSYTRSMPHVAAKGTGISVLGFDAANARIELLQTCDNLSNPSYLAVSSDRSRIYAVEELDEADGAAVVSLDLDRATCSLTLTSRQGAQGDCPCHISLSRDGTRALVANYGTGSFVSYPVGASGVLAMPGEKVQRTGRGPNPERQQGPHVHQVVPSASGRGVFVCDAGTDEILHYPFARAGCAPEPDQVLRAPPGALPRHLVQSADGDMLFVVHELDCSVSSYRRGANGWGQMAKVPTLPVGCKTANACAAIRLHPNGRFLYVSNRGADNIAAFGIDKSGGFYPIGCFASGGRTPRDINIDPSGRFLVAANQDSHTLCLFAINGQSGALSPIGAPFAIGSPTCVVFA